MSAESFNFKTMIHAFEAAFEHGDVDTWNAYVRANHGMPIPLWVLDSLALKSIFPMERRNRERNVRLDMHDRALAAITAHLGIEPVGTPPPPPIATSKPHGRHRGEWLRGTLYRADDYVVHGAKGFLALREHHADAEPGDPLASRDWQRLTRES